MKVAARRFYGRLRRSRPARDPGEAQAKRARPPRPNAEEVDMNWVLRCLVAFALSLSISVPALALTVPFVEDFAADASGWLDAVSAPLTWNAAGGPDGSSYVSSTLGSINDPGTVQFRGNISNFASGGALAGDWTSSVSSLSAQVRHDAQVPLNFFFRVTTGVNFPAHVGIVPVPVLPNTWTEISVLINPNNPLLVPEFGTFAGTFGAVTNVQVGVSVPLAFENVPFTYDLDQVSIVPEPGTAALLGVGLLGVALRRRAGR